MSRHATATKRPALVTYLKGQVTLSASGGGYLLQVSSPVLNFAATAPADRWEQLDALAKASKEIIRRWAPLPDVQVTR